MVDLTNLNECTIVPHGETVTAYADRPYAERFAVMGVPAESAFETWAASREVVIDRLGFDRSPLPKEAMLQLPSFVRHAPDYVLYEDGFTYLVDCVGTANPSGFKVRASKLEALEFYKRNGGLPLFFVYYSPNNSYSIQTYDTVQALKGPLEHFANDGNAYHFVPQGNTWLPIG